eukprot:m51a1_g736 hypothetical protein (299) ;mRNA; f:490102-491196
MSLSINVQTRSGGAIGTYELPAKATVADLKSAIAKNRGRDYPVIRQALSIDVNHQVTQLNDPVRELSSYGLRSGDAVFLKKLGPQMAFRTVYIIEYLGPLVLYPLTAFLTADLRKLTSIQQIAMLLWVVHFTKRILETIFVHEFGNMTMPVFPNLFRNCAYYWFFGLACGYDVNRAWASELPMWHLYAGFLAFSCCMLMNGICHLQLKQLSHERAPGSTALVMPHGGLFEIVTAPNYLFEILTWVSFNVLTGFQWAGIAFSCCGIYQMNQWAREKHAKYQKLFKNYPKRRRMLIPFVY